MDSMIAYVTNEYGADARFQKTELPVPELLPGQVLIRVEATSVNPIDNKILRQELGLNPELPAILHGDVAGVVSQMADDVTDFAIGDEVYGCAGGFIGSAGALADFMPADAKLLAQKPENFSFKESAALPLVSITAWESIIDSAGMKEGEFVLIHAGVGGVGHIALQIAKAKGARVATTVADESAADLAKSLGADEVILYKKEAVADYVARLTSGKGFDLVYDTVGGANTEHSLQAVRNYGRIVTVFTASGSNTLDLSTAYMKGAAVHTQNMSIPLVSGIGREHHRDILQQVTQWAEEGKLRPLLDPHSFSFDQCNEAHAHLESGTHRGKVVISRN